MTYKMPSHLEEKGDGHWFETDSVVGVRQPGLCDGVCSLCADARISPYFGVQKGLSVFYTAQ